MNVSVPYEGDVKDIEQGTSDLLASEFYGGADTIQSAFAQAVLDATAVSEMPEVDCTHLVEIVS